MLRVLFSAALLFIVTGGFSQRHAPKKVSLAAVDSLLKAFTSNTISKVGITELRKMATELQNEGFLLAERERNFPKSLLFIDRSLRIWTTTNDSVNEANVRKFKGLLLAELGKFRDAKDEVNRPSNCFQSRENNGV